MTKYAYAIAENVAPINPNEEVNSQPDESKLSNYSGKPKKPRYIVTRPEVDKILEIYLKNKTQLTREELEPELNMFGTVIKTAYPRRPALKFIPRPDVVH